MSIEEIIDGLEDINYKSKMVHMSRDMFGENTKDDIERYITNFKLIRDAIDSLSSYKL